MLLSSASINQSDILATQTIQSTAIVQAASASVLSENKIGETQPASVEQYVRNYYADTPILASIAGCESHFHQYTKSGDVVRGLIDPDDIGVMQINERFNGDLAKKQGYDIYTLQGNLAFGKWMYVHEGTHPWTASQSCWINK